MDYMMLYPRWGADFIDKLICGNLANHYDSHSWMVCVLMCKVNAVMWKFSKFRTKKSAFKPRPRFFVWFHPKNLKHEGKQLIFCYLSLWLIPHRLFNSFASCNIFLDSACSIRRHLSEVYKTFNYILFWYGLQLSPLNVNMTCIIQTDGSAKKAVLSLINQQDMSEHALLHILYSWWRSPVSQQQLCSLKDVNWLNNLVTK